jgi:VWFA-related protein
MPKSFLKIAAGWLAFAVCAGVASAQSAPAPEQGTPAGVEQGYQVPTITVNARIVVLDVVVTDKKGNLVQRQLDKDDFTVFEDGIAQRIRSFEAPSAHRMPGGDAAVPVPIVNSAADLKKIGDAPVTILVLDELNSRFEDMSYSRQMMVKYLQSQPAVLKQPTVLMIAMNTTFQQVHDYTQNRDQLIEIVKKHMPEYPWRMMNSGKTGSGAVERMAQVLAALQQIAQASQGTPGRKNLIWVGNGFPSADLVGLPADEGATIEAAIKRCTTRLLAARITMYSINPTPDASSTVEVDDPDDLSSAQNENGGDPFGSGSVSFANLAPSTGGIAYTGRNDINNVIGEGIAKGQEYYTLSYSPSGDSTAAAQFRKIRIVMKDPNLRATTRDGYYPDTAADLNPVVDKTMKAKQVTANLKLDLSNALLSTVSYNGLAVTAEKTAKGTYTIHVAENGLGWSEEAPEHAEATLAAAWYDSKNKLIGHVAREETFKRAGPNDGATFTLPVEVPGGAARLRFAVRDAINGHMGTVDVTKF